MGFDLGNKKGGVKPTMNVTPLVNVVLVLLIIFMVITPMMVKQISVNVPTKNDKVAEPADAEAEPQVVLRVGASGTIYINKTAVTEVELEGKLRRVFAARSDQTLFFDAHESVPFENALAVLDRARGVGLSTIAVLTEAVN